MNNSKLQPSKIQTPPAGVGGKAQRRRDAGARLGNTTKFADTPNSKNLFDSTIYDQKTGEIFYFSINKHGDLTPTFDHDASLAERWLMLHTARRVLSTPIGDYQKSDLWQDRLKTYRAPYSCLKSVVLFTDLATRKVQRVKSHQIGLPVVKNAINTIDGSAYSDLDSGLLSNTAATNHSPVFRTVLCCRRRISGAALELWQSPDQEKFSFHNFTVCGSVWSCPVCSAKINYSRQQQIQAAYNCISSVGGRAYMYTLTIPHTRHDVLENLLSDFKNSLRTLGKSYFYKRLLKNPSFLGSIESLEVTWSTNNGWHPHVHGLFFFSDLLLDNPKLLKKFRDDLFSAWQSACFSAGFTKPLSKIHGVDIRPAFSAAEYLSKFGDERTWGPEKEIASSHQKKSKKGFTPFQLLWLIMQNDENSVMYKIKFLEFSSAFKGRHQIQFSRTLRTFLLENGVDVSASDEFLASKLDSDFSIFHTFTDADFQVIVRNNLQSTVLLLARSGGLSAVRALLASFLTDMSISNHTGKIQIFPTIADLEGLKTLRL